MAGQSRLSALDAAFLQVEGSAAHMHVGGVLLFDGPAPAYDELVGMVESRLPRLPRWRQRLAWPAAGLLRAHLRPGYAGDAAPWRRRSNGGAPRR